MGTLAAILPILGIPAGIIIAHFTQSEVKAGKKHLQLLQHVFLCTTLAISAWQSEPIVLLRYATIMVSALLFLGLVMKKVEQHLFFVPILGIVSSITPIGVFLYFIPTGTLHSKEKGKLALACAAFALLTILFSP